MMYQSSLNHYTDENGNPDSIVINGVSMVPNALGKVDFINNFKPSWANALLGMHPEYGRLQFINANVSRSSYD